MSRREPKPRKSRAGRPKGSRGRKCIKRVPVEQRAEAIFKETSNDKLFEGETPREFLTGIMNDPNQSITARIDAAGKLMPYIHRKQPVDVAVEDKRPTTYRFVIAGDEPAAPTEKIDPQPTGE